MAVIALTSGGRAPGVTTCAVAMTLSWPRPCLLVEADVSGSSSILAGLLGGSVPHDRGVVDLAVAQRRGSFSTSSVYDAAIAIPRYEHARLIAGLASPAQAATVAGVWEPLAVELRGLERSGADVIVDAGRLGAQHPPMALLRAADAVVLVTGSTIPSVSAARSWAGILRDDLAAHGAGPDVLTGLVVGEGRPYPTREVGTVVGVPVVATIEWAPATAEAFSLGPNGASPGGGRKLDGSRLMRSIHSANLAVQDMIVRRRARLAPKPRPEGASVRV
jgi:hypothetical protein